MDVVSPGFDATGNKSQVVYEYEGAFRKPDGALAPSLLDGAKMGQDGAVLWISFTAVRPAGCMDQFGGISLYEQFVGEKLFIGSTWMSLGWGIGIPGTGDFPVAATSCDVLTELVARIDFLPGDERVRLYLNPSSPFPTTGEVLDMTVPDFRFDEVGLRSGGSTAVGAPFLGGYEFDALSLSEGTGTTYGSPYCTGDGSATCPCFAVFDLDVGCENSSGSGSGLTGSGNAQVSNDTFRLDIHGVPGAKPGLLVKGSNQVFNAVGDGFLCTGPQQRSHVQITNASGETSFTNFNAQPFGAVANTGGVPTYFQFWYRDPENSCGGGFNFSNAWDVTFLP